MEALSNTEQMILQELKERIVPYFYYVTGKLNYIDASERQLAVGRQVRVALNHFVYRGQISKDSPLYGMIESLIELNTETRYIPEPLSPEEQASAIQTSLDWEEKKRRASLVADSIGYNHDTWRRAFLEALYADKLSGMAYPATFINSFGGWNGRADGRNHCGSSEPDLSAYHRDREEYHDDGRGFHRTFPYG